MSKRNMWSLEQLKGYAILTVLGEPEAIFQGVRSIADGPFSFEVESIGPRCKTFYEAWMACCKDSGYTPTQAEREEGGKG